MIDVTLQFQDLFASEGGAPWTSIRYLFQKARKHIGSADVNPVYNVLEQLANVMSSLPTDTSIVTVKASFDDGWYINFDTASAGRCVHIDESIVPKDGDIVAYIERIICMMTFMRNNTERIDSLHKTYNVLEDECHRKLAETFIWHMEKGLGIW